MRKVTIGSIVLSNLRQRRSQNRVLAVGVTLAVFFLAACVFGASCLLASYQRENQDRYGEADYLFLNSEGIDIPSLFPASFRMRLTEQQILFACLGEGESEGASFSVARYDEAAAGLLHARLSEGRWPEREGEIAVESAALWRMRLQANVGDTLEFTVVGWDGEKRMESTERRSFTVTGLLVNQDANVFYSDSPLGPSLATAWVSEEEPLIAGSRPQLNTFVQADGWRSRWIILRDSLKPYQNQMQTRWYGQGLFGEDRYVSHLNTDILDFLVANTGAFLGFAVLFAALVTASMAGVAAAVMSNADQRRAQVGMLRAIGATKRQIGRILRRETMAVCLLTLPVGIGCVLLGLWALTRLMPDIIVFFVPWPLIAAVTALCAAFLAAATVRPVKKAANVSPMQALRDVEMLRRQRETRARSRRRFRPATLLAARNIGFHRGRAAAIVVLIVAGTLLVCVAGHVGDELIGAYSAKLTNDYHIYLGWGRDDAFGNWEYGERLFTRRDKQDLENIPYVSYVGSEQNGVVCILLDELSPYITGDGWNPEASYFFADGPAYAHYVQSMGGREYDESLAGEWPEHERYRLFLEQYGIGREALQASLIAVDSAAITRIVDDVYDGRIDVDAINAGREVVIVAPKNYYEFMEFTEGHGDTVFQGYASGRFSSDDIWDTTSWHVGMPEEKVVHENDTFFAGNTVDLCWFMSYDGYSHASRAYPVQYSRVDVSPTIGAVASRSPFGYGWSDWSVITTESGLAAMGMEARYEHFTITLSDEIDEMARDEITSEIRAVAGRVDSAQLVDFHVAAQRDRAMYRAIFTAVLVVIVLLFTFTATLINSSVSGRIRSEEKQIGTMRAVGANRRAIAASYTLQVWRMLRVGGAIGWGAYILVRAVSAYMGFRGQVDILTRLRAIAHNLAQWQTFTPPVFLALLFGVCAMSVRARLRPIFAKPVVENIRIL